MPGLPPPLKTSNYNTWAKINTKEYKNMEEQISICEKCENYFFTDEQNVSQGFVRLETCKKEHFNKLIKKLRTEAVLFCKDFEEISKI